MGLTMKERYTIVRELAPRYQRACKRERSRILDEFVSLTGLTRCYASHLLKHYGTRISLRVNGRRRVFIVGDATGETHRRRRSPYYDQSLLAPLERLWAISNGLCGKRLAVFIRTALPILEHWKELSIDETTRAKLLAVSPATIDRLLAPVKARSRLKGRSTTKPGTLLKHHIPIRTFADWDESIPGFVEIDLVAHDGGCAAGDFCQTLDVTDIATGWTETWPVRNKAQRHVFEALQTIRRRLPFALLGIDSDNGGEFINNQLRRWCEREQISFTRSRPYRKNDNCFVEQKNYSVVRTMVGYYRYDQREQLLLLERIYRIVRLHSNFFQPSMKLREKTRIGSKVTRRYDPPLTPYQRVLDHVKVADDAKKELMTLYQTLNPAELMRALAKLQKQLFDSAIRAPKLIAPRPGYPSPQHPWRNQNLESRATLASNRKNQNNISRIAP